MALAIVQGWTNRAHGSRPLRRDARGDRTLSKDASTGRPAPVWQETKGAEAMILMAVCVLFLVLGTAALCVFEIT